MQPLPPLFERVPPGLFGPLAGLYAPLYWDILGCFYQLEFEREPLFLVRDTALELALEILRGSPFWAERREELLHLDEDSLENEPVPLDEGELARATARRLLIKLERSGWFHFEYRAAVGHILCFHPYAARLLETLARVARDEQPLFQGFAHAIAALLRPESIAARPGVALREAKRHTLEMMRELKILERNIFAFTQRLLDEIATAADLLEESFERYRGAVLANYHRLKTVDNLYKWRGEILHRLDVIEKDSLAKDGAARWYAEQDRLDNATAACRVFEDMALLRAEFDALPRIIDEIDTRNSRFSGVALRKLMYLLKHDKRIEGQLQLIVDRLATDRAPELEFDVFACELFGTSFLYNTPTKKPRPERQLLVRKPRSDREALRKSVAARLRRPFARARVDDFVLELFAARNHVTTADVPLTGDEDYVRSMYMVAYGLDGGSPYRFERISAKTDPVTKSGYTIPAGTVAKRRR